MRDRLSTKILSNGATRYGVYDETGNLLRYEYIKLEDEPTVEGDLFSKANMLPDSIPAALGLKMGNPQVKDALNVLANIGNVHVWQRVQTLVEPMYELGETENVNISYGPKETLTTGSYATWFYSDTVSVDEHGIVSLVGETETNQIYFNASANARTLIGKFARVEQNTYGSKAPKNVIFYFPAGQTERKSNGADVEYNYAVFLNGRRVTGQAAETTTDYLTSTDENAYPKQSAEGGQDAYYTLGDVVSGSFGLGRMNASTNMTYKVSDSIDVLDDGTIVMNDSTVVYVGYGGASTLTSVQSSFLGKFVCRINDGDTTHDSYTKLPKDEVVYIPSDAIITSEAVSSSTVFNVDQYQPVTGYPAIPANNVITYLGQLGAGRMQRLSYVGTGVYGEENKNSLTFDFNVNAVLIFVDYDYNGFSPYGFCKPQEAFVVTNTSRSTDTAGRNSIQWDGETVSWWFKESVNFVSANDEKIQVQLNISGITYTCIGFS